MDAGFDHGLFVCGVGVATLERAAMNAATRFQSKKHNSMTSDVRLVKDSRQPQPFSSKRQCIIFHRLARRMAVMLTLMFFVASNGWAEQTEGSPSVIVVVGASGIPQYEIMFYQWSERWASAAKDAGANVTVIGRHRGEFVIEGTDYDRLQSALKDAATETQRELWIVLIGHGTFDQRVAKFNLRGPDVSAQELAQWLQPVQRPTAIINCASASGPFIPVLSGPNRVVVTATKAGSEINFSRFGDFLSQAIGNPDADLDKKSPNFVVGSILDGIS